MLIFNPILTHLSRTAFIFYSKLLKHRSASHHLLRKHNERAELIINATRKCGGIYLYSNQRGCDGGRLYYDGNAMIVCNGKILAQASRFSMNDIEVT